jgi:hypothetical protein
MDMLQPYLYLIYIALGVIALALLLWIAMRFLGGTVRGRKGSRLAISEYYEIDKTRRLVLVRRDDVEHLVLIGGNQDVVIESEITSPLTDSGPQAMRQAPRPICGPWNRATCALCVTTWKTDAAHGRHSQPPSATGRLKPSGFCPKLRSYIAA